MELLYIWIDEFRNIEKQGFNFSSKFKFDIVQLQGYSGRNYELSISLNEDYVSLFPNNIVGVTGIVGKNGSGKSTLLHCLKLLSGGLERLTTPLIFCLFERESNRISTFYFKNGAEESMMPLNVSLRSSRALRNVYKVARPKSYSLTKSIGITEKISGMGFEFKDQVSCCYFSNAFDSHNEAVYNGIVNISTNARVDNFLSKYIEREINDALKKSNQPKALNLFPSHMREYHKQELRTVLKFISYASTRKTRNIPDIPSEIIISFNFDDYRYLCDDLSKTSILYKKEDLEKIHRAAITALRRSKDKRSIFSNLILLGSFYYILRWDLFKPNRVSADEVRTAISKIGQTKDSVFIKINQLISQLNVLDDEDLKSTSIADLIGVTFKKTLGNISFVSNPAISELTTFIVKADTNLFSLLNAIYDLKYTVESSFIDYYWRGLSTGEEAFLNHFARLNDAKKELRQKTVWLLIDEGDLYFHPQWQKEYLDQLLSYVNFIFPRNRVQVFLTTHSPFIASDLPKQNLIFLKKNESGKCVTTEDEAQKETFGANIHELFTDSFFLEGGLIGEFAKKQIQQIIDWLNIPSTQEHIQILSKINIVGEPIIKVKLIEMYENKMGGGTEELRIREQIKILSKRLKELPKNDTNKNNPAKKSG